MLDVFAAGFCADLLATGALLIFKVVVVGDVLRTLLSAGAG